ncbi:MAG: aldehyde dehydrogenase family protein [Actinobacteria bacterium]|nr:aldehyde dehydrogenase family protein [Actinomycetota bacterium]
MLINGEWVDAVAGEREDVTSPFDGRVVGTVPLARAADATRAIDAAVSGFDRWRRTPAHERAAILMRAAALADERAENIANIMSGENGKSLLEARGEAGRSGEIIRLSAFEGSQLYGETLPLDANKGTGFDKIGFTIRQPVGVVVAISPFNYPALLVLHKIAPALAAGNAVVLKPARSTPLTALAVAQCFVDAGLPAGVLNVVTGPGAEVGDALVRDRRVRKISFTGSTAVGEHIASIAGITKMSLELGASGPVIVLDDADIDAAAHSISLGGYINAGQVCISAQRIIVAESIVGDFLDALTPKVQAIRVGDPFASDTMVGSMISRTEADRVTASIRAAVAAGARLVTGGEQDGSLIQPAIVAEVDPYSAFAQDELFGPAVAISTARDVNHAIELANSTAYGLGAGVFTNNIANSIHAIREIESGVVHINWTQLWRADLMPYGGLKSSGIGKEGPRSAIAEMTEVKTVIMHGTPWTTNG